MGAAPPSPGLPVSPFSCCPQKGTDAHLLCPLPSAPPPPPAPRQRAACWSGGWAGWVRSSLRLDEAETEDKAAARSLLQAEGKRLLAGLLQLAAGHWRGAPAQPPARRSPCLPSIPMAGARLGNKRTRCHALAAGSLCSGARSPGSVPQGSGDSVEEGHSHGRSEGHSGWRCKGRSGRKQRHRAGREQTTAASVSSGEWSPLTARVPGCVRGSSAGGRQNAGIPLAAEGLCPVGAPPPIPGVPEWGGEEDRGGRGGKARWQPTCSPLPDPLPPPAWAPPLLPSWAPLGLCEACGGAAGPAPGAPVESGPGPGYCRPRPVRCPASALKTVVTWAQGVSP